ncbi:thioredoxin family protein [Paludibacterium purpuratum]|uniref:Thioredoxin n=1 Tax=Paludibacterium purpuratum TaxID=1144873 RepID=A0A4R7B922_9NEIS|nr:thioredoxin family protein [Paludibacterium purpuratum]TDR80087.1 thioredoxin [Paludibacterium purpuratum]
MNLCRFVILVTLATVMALARAGDIKPYSQQQFDQLSAQGRPVVLAIHASWCPTCKVQKPILAQLMQQPAYREVTLLQIDFDTDKPLLARYHVDMQSTLIAFKGRHEVVRTVGDTTSAGIEQLVKATLR